MSRIVWYGERGIANALVTDLASRDISGARQFFQAIHWAGDVQPRWIGDIQDATFIVEIGLACFGDPDLIVVARTSSGERKVAFVEAKIGTYLESAVPNDPGMAERGFNSSLNGQLSLKYRCSKALENWDGETGLREPDMLKCAYSRPPVLGGLGDGYPVPRHLQKRTVLRILREQGLAGLSPDDYHFVVWTNDLLPFWQQHFVRQANLLPRFLRPMPDGAECWDEIRPRIGWLSYDRVSQVLNPSSAYQDAVRAMIVSEATQVAVTMVMPRVDGWGPCVQNLLRRLAMMAKEDNRIRVNPGQITSTIRRPRHHPFPLIARVTSLAYARERGRPSEELMELDSTFVETLSNEGVQIVQGRVAIPSEDHPAWVEQIMRAVQAAL